MGQKLRDDKIGLLSHSSGTITVAASTSVPTYLTIGGQQYKVTTNLSRTIATDLAMVANNLYMVYAVRNSGNTELRISTNVNSVGPAGFSSWKLVGAFYANKTPAWGTFVTIEGVPVSNTWDAGLVDLRQSSTPITKGGTPVLDATFVRRVGNKVYIQIAYAKTGAGGSEPGGAYQFVNSLFPENPAEITGTTSEDTVNGVGQVTTPGDGRNIHIFYNSGATWDFRYTTPTNTLVSNVTHSYAANTFRIGAAWEYPVLAWTNTPLKDL